MVVVTSVTAGRVSVVVVTSVTAERVMVTPGNVIGTGTVVVSAGSVRVEPEPTTVTDVTPVTVVVTVEHWFPPLLTVLVFPLFPLSGGARSLINERRAAAARDGLRSRRRRLTWRT